MFFILNRTQPSIPPKQHIKNTPKNKHTQQNVNTKNKQLQTYF